MHPVQQTSLSDSQCQRCTVRHDAIAVALSGKRVQGPHSHVQIVYSVHTENWRSISPVLVPKLDLPEEDLAASLRVAHQLCHSQWFLAAAIQSSSNNRLQCCEGTCLGHVPQIVPEDDRISTQRQYVELRNHASGLALPASWATFNTALFSINFASDNHSTYNSSEQEGQVVANHYGWQKGTNCG